MAGPPFTTGPRVVGAQARARRRVRLSFDVAVRQADAADPQDALHPANYTLARTSAPAVDAVVVAVEPIAPGAVELVTDVELTGGALYRVQVERVVDTAGNPIGPPADSATFAGLVPARPAGRRFELEAMLPVMNLREDETGDLRRFVACLQEVADLLLDDIDGFTDILDPDVAPERFVDSMLEDLGNPFGVDLSELDKRRLVRVLVEIYRQKGTAIGLRNAARFLLGLEIEIRELQAEALVLGESELGVDWILGPSSSYARYTFEVVVPRVLSAGERRRLHELVDYMKPAHTHFRLVEPAPPPVVEHVELGVSELGASWELH
jgi:phage tail-like protein